MTFQVVFISLLDNSIPLEFFYHLYLSYWAVAWFSFILKKIRNEDLPELYMHGRVFALTDYFKQQGAFWWQRCCRQIPKVLLQCSNKVQRDSWVQVIDIINTNRKFEVTTGKQYKNHICFLWTLKRNYKKGKLNKDQVKYLIYTCIFNIHLTMPHSYLKQPKCITGWRHFLLFHKLNIIIQCPFFLPSYTKCLCYW